MNSKQERLKAKWAERKEAEGKKSGKTAKETKEESASVKEG